MVGLVVNVKILVIVCVLVSHFIKNRKNVGVVLACLSLEN
jgi:hypothetical protein